MTIPKNYNPIVIAARTDAKPDIQLTDVSTEEYWFQEKGNSRKLKRVECRLWVEEDYLSLFILLIYLLNFIFILTYFFFINFHVHSYICIYFHFHFYIYSYIYFNILFNALLYV